MRNFTILAWARFIFYLKYTVYFMVTMDERNRYWTGMNKGARCVKVKHGVFSSMAFYDGTKEPIREYMTYKEFKKGRYPVSVIK